MKNHFSILICFSLLLVGCASYPNYYIKDSTITTQQTTQQMSPPVQAWGVAPVPFVGNAAYFVPPVYGWGTGGWGGGGWGGGGWGGWGGGGWNRWGGCW